MMIIQVDENNINEAARIHSISWQDSHRSFCEKEFVELHSIEHQRKYLLDKLNDAYEIFMLLDGEPVGIVSVKENLIEDLYVLPQMQNKGYGTELLKYACQKCIGKPTLWILENNVNAARLYKRFGFTETGRRQAITENLDEIEFELSK
ncbi:MAG: GNAT family N-acetyltransferase [Treponema sp.]|nr:GNAT family N-acetyltransferase [Treponema sp.]